MARLSKRQVLALKQARASHGYARQQEAIYYDLVIAALSRVARGFSELIAAGKPVDPAETAHIKTLWAAEVPDLTEAAASIYQSAGDALGRKAGGSVTEQMRTAYLRNTAQRLTDVGDGMWDAATKSLSQGVIEGEGYEQLTQRLLGMFEEGGEAVSESKAAQITRTTVQSAVNGGSNDAMNNSDNPPQYKTWVCTADTNTRIEHWEADGQTVPADGMFEVGGELLAFAGDPDASDGAVINCRCTQTYGDDPNIDVPLAGRGFKTDDELADVMEFFAQKGAGRSEGLDLSAAAAAAQPVYLVVGCPGSGKSWVCDQLASEYTYVHHDLYMKMTGDPYVEAIAQAASTSARPVLAETPFSISSVTRPLASLGIRVVPVFIQEDRTVISERYLAREGRLIPKGHLTRQDTYAQRARLTGAFAGTSSEVLAYLRVVAADRDYERDDDGQFGEGPGEPNKEPEPPTSWADVQKVVGEQSFSDSQKEALDQYQSEGYEYINESLRETDGATSEDPLAVKELDAAFNSVEPLSDPITVERGMTDADAAFGPVGSSVGSTFTDHGFVSTSTDPTIADQFGSGEGSAVIRVEVPAGEKAIAMTSEAGVAETEREVLLPRGSTFEVTSDSLDPNGRRVISVLATAA